MDAWTHYHLMREEMKRSLGQFLESPDLLLNSDLYQSFMVLDKKIEKELKSTISTLVMHYTLLMDVIEETSMNLFLMTENGHDPTFNLYM